MSEKKLVDRNEDLEPLTEREIRDVYEALSDLKEGRFDSVDSPEELERFLKSLKES